MGAGVGGVDVVGVLGQEQRLGADLRGAQGGGRIGREEGAAGSAGEDDDAALFQVAHGAAADVGLGDLAHLDGGLHAALHVAAVGRAAHAQALDGVLHGQGVEDGREHAHVVGRGAVHLDHGALAAAPDVAAADDQGDLQAADGQVHDLAGDLLDGFRAESLAVFAQRLAGELDQYALIDGFHADCSFFATLVLEKRGTRCSCAPLFFVCFAV